MATAFDADPASSRADVGPVAMRKGSRLGHAGDSRAPIQRGGGSRGGAPLGRRIEVDATDIAAPTQ